MDINNLQDGLRAAEPNPLSKIVLTRELDGVPLSLNVSPCSWMYRRMRHLTLWATRILNAEALAEEAASKATVPLLSFAYENAEAAESGLKQVKSEKGAVVASLWFEPKETSDEDEEIEEKYFPCPMCQI